MGEITFYQVREEVDEWDFEAYTVLDPTLTYNNRSAVKVIRRVTNEIIRWIKRTSPHYFCFKANEPRKAAIYAKIMTREVTALTGYHSANDQGAYHIYRLVTQR